MRTLAKEIGEKIGEKVELIGWVDSRRDHGRLIFIDLRDRSGIAQTVFLPNNKEVHAAANKLRSEWVIKITGEVAKRPPGMENRELPNGDLEVAVAHLEVINQAETLPIDISGKGYEINEEVRLSHRYIDLRRGRLQKNLRERHRILNFCREFLSNRDFVEIETPILGKSTPEGARDYLVPSRIYPGSFYALPQSPQQYKQLLMVSGFERYFQVARCFRDEDTRGDRQPEFTQLDIEMSFVDAEDVMKLTEELFTELVERLYPNYHITKKPFPRLNFSEVMEKHQSDKPDLRDNKNDPNELAFAFVLNFPAFEWKPNERPASASADVATSAKGAKALAGRWDAVHHPFTMPLIKKDSRLQTPDSKEFKEAFKKNPQDILAVQYDLVLNGYEVGGGSIRIHEPELLAAVFEAMGNKKEDIQANFGHMLEAFKYGVPPHGGIAPGIDRLVMILRGEPNIREVIAFPKTGDGRDLMMGAPSAVKQDQLKELDIKFNKK